jgi:hypothetical protein
VVVLNSDRAKRQPRLREPDQQDRQWFGGLRSYFSGYAKLDASTREGTQCSFLKKWILRRKFASSYYVIPVDPATFMEIPKDVSIISKGAC